MSNPIPLQTFTAPSSRSCSTSYGRYLILDDLLPARLGDSVLDYQLLEEEDERGLFTIIGYSSVTMWTGPSATHDG